MFVLDRHLFICYVRSMESQIHAQIKTVRKSLGLTQVQFAKKLKVSRTDIANWETRVVPNADIWLRIIKLKPTIERTTK